MKDMSSPEFKLKEVCIRLTEGTYLSSNEPISTSYDAIKLMKRELATWDREIVCVVNMNTRGIPINFNIVNMGGLQSSVVSIPNLFKTAILSNASSFILLHNHPSGDPTPSSEDIRLTRLILEASELMQIKLLDHVIVGGITGDSVSLRDLMSADFNGGFNPEGISERVKTEVNKNKGSVKHKGPKL